MNCDQTREILSSFLDGMPDDDESRKIKAHLQACPSCQKEFQTLKNLRQLTLSLPVVAAPPDFLFRLNRRIERRNMPFWKKASRFIVRGLERAPLRGLTAAAGAVLLFTVLMSGGTPRGINDNLARLRAGEDSTYPQTLSSSTEPVPVEFASTNPGSPAVSSGLFFDSPNDLVMAIIEQDPDFNGYQVLPHPRGVGAIINTKDYLLEVIMEPEEFPFIQTHVEHVGRIPSTLRQAKTMYPIYIRLLPSPTAPIAPEE